MTSFFAAYDALCEEGTATPVCEALDEVADISVPGKNYIEIKNGIFTKCLWPFCCVYK